MVKENNVKSYKEGGTEFIERERGTWMDALK